MIGLSTIIKMILNNFQIAGCCKHEMPRVFVPVLPPVSDVALPSKPRIQIPSALPSRLSTDNVARFAQFYWFAAFSETVSFVVSLKNMPWAKAFV